MAYIKPFGVLGEVAIAGSWAQPINTKLRDQYGVEAYWKLLVTPRIWATPGVQLIFDPSNNPSTNRITIPQIKARVFF